MQYLDKIYQYGYSVESLICHNNDCSIYALHKNSDQKSKYMLKIKKGCLDNRDDNLVVDSMILDNDNVGLVYSVSHDSLQEEGADYFSYCTEVCDDSSEKTVIEQQNKNEECCLKFDIVDSVLHKKSNSGATNHLPRTPMPPHKVKDGSSNKNNTLRALKFTQIVRTPVPKNMKNVYQSDKLGSEDEEEEEDDDDDDDDEEEDDEEFSDSESDGEEDDEEEEEDEIYANYDLQNHETVDIEHRVRRVSIGVPSQDNHGVKSILSQESGSKCNTDKTCGILTPPYNSLHLNPDEHIKIESPLIFLHHNHKNTHIPKTPIPKCMNNSSKNEVHFPGHSLRLDSESSNPNFTEYNSESDPKVSGTLNNDCKFNLKMLHSSMLKRRRIKEVPL